MSSYKERFLKDWNEFIALVKSDIRRRIDENGTFTIAEINTILATERNRWFDSSRPQGAWLKKLKEYDSAIGSDFEQKLKSMTLKDMDIPTNDSPVPPTLISVGLGLGVGLIANALNWAWWKVGGVTLLTLVFVGGAVLTHWKDKNNRKKIFGRDQCLQQLELYRLELVKLCEEMDAKLSK
jgi:hypothetical protein